MTYYLGLDAGGTKTECALAAEEAVLAHTTGGCIKTLRVPVEQAEENLDALLRSISQQSGVTLDAIACTCVGQAGISIPRVADWTRQALHARVSGDVLLVGDEEIALDAAFEDRGGVLVVAGTGSNIIGRTATGQTIHVGGWGPMLADEGSGSWIGKQAVRAVFDARDRGETTLLLEKILQRWNLPDAGSLLDHANRLSGADFPALTRIVAECAQQHDPYATNVLERAGQSLAMDALLAAERIRQPHEYPEFAFTGGVLRHILPVREAMCVAIRHAMPQARIQPEPVDSLRGALWLARRHSEAAIR